MGRLVHTGLGSSSRSTCPSLSPSPHANSFIIGSAFKNTHTHTHPGSRSEEEEEEEEEEAEDYSYSMIL